MSHRCKVFALSVGVRLLHTFMNEVLTDLPGSFGNLSRTKVKADFLDLIITLSAMIRSFLSTLTLMMHKDFCCSRE